MPDTTKPEVRAAAESAGVKATSFEHDGISSQIFSGFVLKYGAESEVIPFWPPDDKPKGLEFFITTSWNRLPGCAGGRRGLELSPQIHSHPVTLFQLTLDQAETARSASP